MPNNPDKGLYNGSCNRTACQGPNANWYNHGTQLYYCGCCAKEMNEDPFVAQDAARIWGHPMLEHCPTVPFEESNK